MAGPCGLAGVLTMISDRFYPVSDWIIAVCAACILMDPALNIAGSFRKRKDGRTGFSRA